MHVSAMISGGGWGLQGWGLGLRQAPCSWVSRIDSPPSTIQETEFPFLTDTLPSPLSILLLLPQSRGTIPESMLLVAFDLGQSIFHGDTELPKIPPPSPFLAFSPDHRKISRDIHSGANMVTAAGADSCSIPQPLPP